MSWVRSHRTSSDAHILNYNSVGRSIIFHCARSNLLTFRDFSPLKAQFDPSGPSRQGFNLLYSVHGPLFLSYTGVAMQDTHTYIYTSWVC